MISVDNGTTVTYVYNGVGQRAEKLVGGGYSEMAYGAFGQEAGFYNRSAWGQAFVDFNGNHLAHYQDNTVYFMHSSQLGTAGVVTDSTGAVIQDELHYPWGQTWTLAGTSHEERFGIYRCTIAGSDFPTVDRNLARRQ